MSERKIPEKEVVSERKWGLEKENMIILTDRNILQVGDDTGNQTAEWR